MIVIGITYIFTVGGANERMSAPRYDVAVPFGGGQCPYNIFIDQFRSDDMYSFRPPYLLGAAFPAGNIQQEVGPRAYSVANSKIMPDIFIIESLSAGNWSHKAFLKFSLPTGTVISKSGK
jgi:hypothetical protein